MDKSWLRSMCKNVDSFEVTKRVFDRKIEYVSSILWLMITWYVNQKVVSVYFDKIFWFLSEDLTNTTIKMKGNSNLFGPTSAGSDFYLTCSSICFWFFMIVTFTWKSFMTRVLSVSFEILRSTQVLLILVYKTRPMILDHKKENAYMYVLNWQIREQYFRYIQIYENKMSENKSCWYIKSHCKHCRQRAPVGNALSSSGTSQIGMFDIQATTKSKYYDHIVLIYLESRRCRYRSIIFACFYLYITVVISLSITQI